VTSEDAAAELVGLALPDDAHPCALEAEVEASDAREEAADIHSASIELTGCSRGVLSRVGPTQSKWHVRQW
jgi:hypothetical protein